MSKKKQRDYFDTNDKLNLDLLMDEAALYDALSVVNDEDEYKPKRRSEQRRTNPLSIEADDEGLYVDEPVDDEDDRSIWDALNIDFGGKKPKRNQRPERYERREDNRSQRIPKTSQTSLPFITTRLTKSGYITISDHSGESISFPCCKDIEREIIPVADNKSVTAMWDRFIRFRVLSGYPIAAVPASSYDVIAEDLKITTLPPWVQVFTASGVENMLLFYYFGEPHEVMEAINRLKGIIDDAYLTSAIGTALIIKMAKNEVFANDMTDGGAMLDQYTVMSIGKINEDVTAKLFRYLSDWSAGNNKYSKEAYYEGRAFEVTRSSLCSAYESYGRHRR